VSISHNIQFNPLVDAQRSRPPNSSWIAGRRRQQRVTVRSQVQFEGLHCQQRPDERPKPAVLRRWIAETSSAGPGRHGSKPSNHVHTLASCSLPNCLDPSCVGGGDAEGCDDQKPPTIEGEPAKTACFGVQNRSNITFSRSKYLPATIPSALKSAELVSFLKIIAIAAGTEGCTPLLGGYSRALDK
jgi:hypothetical protein